MSTAQRRRGKSLHIEISDTSAEDTPAIAALFLIKFDVKAGYTISWKQSIPGLELGESVEFKSLPSGLHNVDEDLVYFMHDDSYAGISAFINRSAVKWERKSLMISVGALVALEHGRLGKSWKHAHKLKELAEHLVLDPTQTDPLEKFWQAHRAASVEEISRDISARVRLDDIADDITSYDDHIGEISRMPVPASGTQGLSSHHPALSLHAYMDTFGPLIFPLYKASLLRKRILIMNQAPVELACNFVYDISILSNIPSNVASLLPLEPLPTRLRPLFSVGVYDIDTLLRKPVPFDVPKDEALFNDPEDGWVACTTDDVLSVKKDLFDILVAIPPSYSHRAKVKVWPCIKDASGKEIKASQRDLRRYRTLCQAMRKFETYTKATSPYTIRSSATAIDDTDDDTDDRSPLLAIRNTQETFDDSSSISDQKLVEPNSWSSLAYSSFLWWASAGEQRADLDDEVDLDTSLFSAFQDASPMPALALARRYSSPGHLTSSGLLSDASLAAPETALVAYFHRFTTTILTVLAKLVDQADTRTDLTADDDDDDSGGNGQISRAPASDQVMSVGSEDMVGMGLDVWSASDRTFVEELLEFYWGRTAKVHGGKIECCGVRIA